MSIGGKHLWRSTYVVHLRNCLDVTDNLPAGSRVKTTCGFIKEEDPGTSDELAGNTESPLLATTDSFVQGSSYYRICLVAQAKRVKQTLDT